MTVCNLALCGCRRLRGNHNARVERVRTRAAPAAHGNLEVVRDRPRAARWEVIPVANPRGAVLIRYNEEMSNRCLVGRHLRELSGSCKEVYCKERRFMKQVPLVSTCILLSSTHLACNAAARYFGDWPGFTLTCKTRESGSAAAAAASLSFLVTRLPLFVSLSLLLLSPLLSFPS